MLIEQMKNHQLCSVNISEKPCRDIGLNIPWIYDIPIISSLYTMDIYIYVHDYTIFMPWIMNLLLDPMKNLIDGEIPNRSTQGDSQDALERRGVGSPAEGMAHCFKGALFWL